MVRQSLSTIGTRWAAILFAAVCLLILSVALTITVGYLLIDRVNQAIWSWKGIEDVCVTEFQPDGTSTLACLREPYLDLRLALLIGIGLAVSFWMSYPVVCRRLGFVQDDRLAH